MSCTPDSRKMTLLFFTTDWLEKKPQTSVPISVPSVQKTSS